MSSAMRVQLGAGAGAARAPAVVQMPKRMRVHAAGSSSPPLHAWPCCAARRRGPRCAGALAGASAGGSGETHAAAAALVPGGAPGGGAARASTAVSSAVAAAGGGVCAAALSDDGFSSGLRRALHRRPRVAGAGGGASLDAALAACSSSAAGGDAGAPAAEQQAAGQQQQQRRRRAWPLPMCLAVAWQVFVWVAIPSAAMASETLSSGLLDVFRQFLEQIQALGPWGAVLFVVTVSLAEMVPLLPTQPLSLASGLLFGAKQGAALMLLGCTLAGLGAFTIARGGGGMGSTWAAVERAIESGGFFKQVTAIALLRLTPVVPYSATNYLLGLTPVQAPAFLIGTLAGMSVWAVLYASLGGASRALLDGGADLELLLVDLGEKASSYSQDIAALGLGVAGVGVVAYLLSRRGAAAAAAAPGGALGAQQPAAGQGPPQAPVQPPAPGQGQGQQQDLLRQEEVLNHK
ncbi:MAG: snare associated Golgi protein-domain-containing protein [Monoraphidium minutum]|nr:MAG: snare associated Golgi protein-domain-containing protein [Monoraphidium minutum]